MSSVNHSSIAQRADLDLALEQLTDNVPKATYAYDQKLKEYFLEFRDRLYVLSNKRENVELIREHERRGVLIRGHVNVMKYRESNMIHL